MKIGHIYVIRHFCNFSNWFEIDLFWFFFSTPVLDDGNWYFIYPCTCSAALSTATTSPGAILSLAIRCLPEDLETQTLRQTRIKTLHDIRNNVLLTWLYPWMLGTEGGGWSPHAMPWCWPPSPPWPPLPGLSPRVSAQWTSPPWASPSPRDWRRRPSPGPSTPVPPCQPIRGQHSGHVTLFTDQSKASV